jgi:NAD+ kinase
MVAIVFRRETPGVPELALQVRERLRALGYDSIIVENSQEQAGVLPAATSSILALGGDGTMLGAARLWAQAGLPDTVPIVGVNMGGLGFLTALQPEELDSALDSIAAGNIAASSRIYLEARLEGKGRHFTFTALNEVVVTKPAYNQLLHLELAVQAQPLTHMRADGIIVATPTGSSAYNLSAGGPICHPDLECLIITPVSPFNFNNRTLLLPPSLPVSIKCRRGGGLLVCDGQAGTYLEPDEQVLIKKAKQRLRLAMLQDYFDILRRKLKWG